MSPLLTYFHNVPRTTYCDVKNVPHSGSPHSFLTFQLFLAKLEEGNLLPSMTYIQHDIFGGAPPHLCQFDYWLDYTLAQRGYYYGLDPTDILHMDTVDRLFLRGMSHYYDVFPGFKRVNYLLGMSFDPTFLSYHAEDIANQASHGLFQMVHFGSFQSFQDVASQKEPEVRMTFSLSFSSPICGIKATKAY